MNILLLNGAYEASNIKIFLKEKLNLKECFKISLRSELSSTLMIFQLNTLICLLNKKHEVLDTYWKQNLGPIKTHARKN